MTLIKVSDSECILTDAGFMAEGSVEEIVVVLTQRLARLLLTFRYEEADDALCAAQEEVSFAFECMRREGHNMADFGIAGHFIRTMIPEIQVAA